MPNLDLDILQIMHGDTPVNKIMKGDTKVWSKLPYDAQVEYLQSTGTQYIDTGVYVTSNNLTIDTRIYTASMPSTEQDIIGNQDDSTGRFVLGLYARYVFGYTRYGSGSEANVTSTTYSGENTLDIKLTLDNSNSTKTLIVNNATTSKSYTKSIINSNQTIKIFKDGRATIKYFVGNIYFVKATQDNTPIFDFIPVRIGQVGYMYDRVSKTLFGNAGTGDFILGNDVN